jgi:putative oxidoreductase
MAGVDGTGAAGGGGTVTFFRHPWVLAGLRWLVGGVFLYAGALKMGNPQAFADSIATFRLLPPLLISSLALGLPVFEMTCGLLLILGWGRRPAALGILLLAGVFAVALGQALVRGLEVDCGCFGGGAPSAAKTWWALGRDFVLSGLAWILYCAEFRRSFGTGED